MGTCTDGGPRGQDFRRNFAACFLPQSQCSAFLSSILGLTRRPEGFSLVRCREKFTMKRGDVFRTRKNKKKAKHCKDCILHESNRIALRHRNLYFQGLASSRAVSVFRRKIRMLPGLRLVLIVYMTSFGPSSSRSHHHHQSNIHLMMIIEGYGGRWSSLLTIKANKSTDDEGSIARSTTKNQSLPL